jgi:hypothetical protein
VFPYPVVPIGPTIVVVSSHYVLNGIGQDQWRMQDGNQGGAKTMEMLICMKI